MSGDDGLLAERTRRLTVAQRIARLGSWSWDPETEDLQVSAELEELLRLPIGEPWTLARVRTVIHPDDLHLAVAALELARRRQPLDHRMRVIRGDGTMAWVQARSDNEADTSPRVLGTWQDITEQVEAEEQRLDLEERLQRAQRLESIGQLAGGIAHDFNNVLAVMGMQADLARRSLSEPVAADALLAQLQATIEQAAGITRKLSVLSRDDRPAMGTTDTTQLLDDLLVVLDRTIGDDVTLTLDHGRDIREVAIAPDELQQVILNLVVNARDAMPKGGSVVLRTRNVEIGDGDARVEQGLAPGQYVEVIVSDTGRGMASEVLERAFEPFFSTKPRTQGTGLGLSTVWGIVRQSGGLVEIVSEQGAGTVVRLVLPAVEVTESDSAPSAAPTGQTVLVVEDQPELRQLISTVLGGAGYRVVTAADGAEALVRAAAEDQLDLLLTDVVMPRLSGQDLAARLAEDRPEVRVLFMSGYAEGGVEVALHKPFRPAQLLAAVASALAGS